MENHRKSYSSLFTFSFHYFITLLVYSVHKEDFFFILSFQEERRNFRGMVRKPSDVERYYSHSSVRRRKTSPFYLLDHCHWHRPIIIMFHEYIPLTSFTSLKRDFPLRCFLVKREETSLHPTYLHFDVARSKTSRKPISRKTYD